MEIRQALRMPYIFHMHKNKKRYNTIGDLPVFGKSFFVYVKERQKFVQNAQKWNEIIVNYSVSEKCLYN